MEVQVVVNLAYPAAQEIIDTFSGTLEECKEWSYNKVQEYLDYFPKYVTVYQDSSIFNENKHDIILYVKRPYRHSIGVYFYE